MWVATERKEAVGWFVREKRRVGREERSELGGEPEFSEVIVGVRAVGGRGEGGEDREGGTGDWGRVAGGNGGGV